MEDIEEKKKKEKSGCKRIGYEVRCKEYKDGNSGIQEQRVSKREKEIFLGREKESDKTKLRN